MIASVSRASNLPLFIVLVLLHHLQYAQGRFLRIAPAIPASPDVIRPIIELNSMVGTFHGLGNAPGLAKPFHGGWIITDGFVYPAQREIQVLQFFPALNLVNKFQPVMLGFVCFVVFVLSMIDIAQGIQCEPDGPAIVQFLGNALAPRCHFARPVRQTLPVVADRSISVD